MLSFAGERPARSYAMSEAFADAARRLKLDLAPSRTSALGRIRGIEVRAELVQGPEQGRLAMRCIAPLSPALGLGLAARTADDRDTGRPNVPSVLEVVAPAELTALALHPDLAELLLAGRVGDVLCKMAEFGFEPRLRDAVAEAWVAQPADAKRLYVAMTATAELAWLAVEERKKLPVAERIRALEAALVGATDDLGLPVESAAGAFDIRLEHGSVRVHLERNGTQAVTVLDLVLDRPFSSRTDDGGLEGLRASAGVESARITDAGSVVVEVGHVATDAGELRPLVGALDKLASGRAHDRSPYR